MCTYSDFVHLIFTQCLIYYTGLTNSYFAVFDFEWKKKKTSEDTGTWTECVYQLSLE